VRRGPRSLEGRAEYTQPEPSSNGDSYRETVPSAPPRREGRPGTVQRSSRTPHWVGKRPTLLVRDRGTPLDLAHVMAALAPAYTPRRPTERCSMASSVRSSRRSSAGRVTRTTRRCPARQRPRSPPTASRRHAAEIEMPAPHVLSIRHWDRPLRGALDAATPRLTWAQLLRHLRRRRPRVRHLRQSTSPRRRGDRARRRPRHP
jgi:hypothetical protein